MSRIVTEKPSVPSATPKMQEANANDIFAVLSKQRNNAHDGQAIAIAGGEELRRQLAAEKKRNEILLAENKLLKEEIEKLKALPAARTHKPDEPAPAKRGKK